ncbi:sugar isomerase domain-containing protein [Lysinibacillus cavernae]|uniref:sugar isomerase domain-containing protein n=1 Tax=Lysinibacillus cavernae TaxID=2666135 RepID=UPI0012D8D072|nr:SIS domain-containing protein [Lysinibacillus cavernae]
MNTYFQQVNRYLTVVAQQESKQIIHVAQQIVNRLSQGGIIQLFGSGHSMLLAQECYYRAGGLVPVKPIHIESLMLHQGARQSSQNEKKQAFLASYKDQLQFDDQDVCIIISTSANNPAPIDMAIYAKEAGAFTISLQSLDYQHQPSRHPSGKRLEHVVDEILNTHVPLGDGVLTVNQLQYAPVSTVLGATLLNALFAQIIELMHEQGETIPVFGSSNVGKNNNDELIDQYGQRIHF